MDPTIYVYESMPLSALCIRVLVLPLSHSSAQVQQTPAYKNLWFRGSGWLSSHLPGALWEPEFSKAPGRWISCSIALYSIVSLRYYDC